jgi:hypothetical protein
MGKIFADKEAERIYNEYLKTVSRNKKSSMDHFLFSAIIEDLEGGNASGKITKKEIFEKIEHEIHQIGHDFEEAVENEADHGIKYEKEFRNATREEREHEAEKRIRRGIRCYERFIERHK